MSKFDITKEEAESILKEMIIPQNIVFVSPQETKQAFILGGQPGSGKSAFARELIKSNKHIVFINGDDLRAYHPRYHFYLKDNDIEAADMTQAVCNFWIESLIQECIKKGLDFIVEGTMRNKEVPMETAQMAHNVSYAVNLVAIATPYELSLRSLEYRYKELKNLGQLARFTKKESHDEAYKNGEETIQYLISSNIFSNIFVYQRIFGAFTGFVFSGEQQKEVLQRFEEGRKRELEDKEKEKPYTSEITFSPLLK